MANLVVQAYPDTGLGVLPDLDFEISLTPPTEGPLFRSVAHDLRISGFSSRRGRSDELQRFSAATFTAMLNNRDRDYDPEYTSSPYYGHIKPMRRCRMLAKYSGTTYVVFDGYTDQWSQEYPGSGNDTVAHVSATDGFKVLSFLELPESMYEFIVAADRPAHWWKLDESSGATAAIDMGFSSSLLTGTYLGTTTLGQSGILTYDGSRTGATFGTTGAAAIPAALIPGTSPWSLELWFKISTIATTASQVLFEMGSRATGANFHVYMQGTNDTDGVISTTWSGSVLVSTSPTRYDDNGTHHLVVTGSTSGGTGTMNVYLDGSLTGTDSAAVATVSSGGVAIGGDLLGFSSLYAAGLTSFAGTMQHVAFYDRVLSASEVSLHYGAGKTSIADTTGSRVDRVRAIVGVPAADRDIDTGNTTLGAYGLSGGSVLDYFQTLAETEQGQFYMGLDGAMSSDHTFDLVWRQRHANLTASRSITSQATFGDGGGSELPYDEIVTDTGETFLFNDVTIGRDGGTNYTVSDADSQHNYYKRSYRKTDLQYQSDNDSFDAANWVLAHYKEPTFRITGLVVKPQRDPTNLWPQVLGREIGDRITVKVRPSGVGSAISKELIINGVEHSMQNAEWTTTWRLSEAETQAYWVLGTSELGTSTRLAF